MRKRRIVAAVAAAAVAVLVLRLVLAHEKEPIAKGHPLSYWVLCEDRQHELSGEKAEADTAILEIGTNGLPLLLKWIQYKEPTWRSTAWKWSLKLPTFWLADKIRKTRTDMLAYNSVGALRALGPQAAPITHDLIGLLTNNPTSDIVFRVNSVLPSIGTNVLPPLICALQDPALSRQRGQLLFAIREVNPPPDVAARLVPLITRFLDDTNFPEMAAYTLGVLHADPTTSVPALIKSLGMSNGLVRLFSARALTNFPTEAPAALTALTNLLDDPSPAVRRTAAKSIRSILSETQAETPPK